MRTEVKDNEREELQPKFSLSWYRKSQPAMAWHRQSCHVDFAAFAIAVQGKRLLLLN